MGRRIWIVMFVLVIGILSACTNAKEQVSEEPMPIEVEFIVPDQANAGEKIILKAVVTHGEEKVKDADEVEFEYWEKGNNEESTKIQSNNNGDGTYTAEVTFGHDGVYEMYAHTTARDMHTMPKKSITIGEGASSDHTEEQQEHSEGHEEGQQEHNEGHAHSGHDEGFALHFMEPKEIKSNQKTQLTVHLQLGNEPLMNADVRYEIINESNSDKHDWVETEETTSGEYTSSYTFAEEGNYTIIIHVKNDKGLHEHEEYQVEIGK
ncbi:FixH family protein [Bacillus sp. Marseille-P3661]|uniref:FixH family protein n=1 Tax=Bacillus sp. Marseille-P3661 TaxID=1936234 RepID=UPI000C85A79B|nr:FixH family protein [Bacillus sp. Marseille-P3661]